MDEKLAKMLHKAGTQNKEAMQNLLHAFSKVEESNKRITDRKEAEEIIKELIIKKELLFDIMRDAHQHLFHYRPVPNDQITDTIKKALDKTREKIKEASAEVDKIEKYENRLRRGVLDKPTDVEEDHY